MFHFNSKPIIACLSACLFARNQTADSQLQNIISVHTEINY